jgi:hypothetical protein
MKGPRRIAVDLKADLHNRDSIIVKYGRDIFRREFIGGVANQQTRLSDSTVANNHAPSSG